MMRYFVSVMLMGFVVLQGIHAQDVSKLNVPTSPAFSILNFEPTAVMRPVSAKELAADVLNSFDKDGKLLLNLGLEVTPYWMKSHPGLDRNTYLHPNTGQTFLQSFSLSAATVKDSASGNNNLGAGFRFKLFNGEPTKELAKASAEQLSKNTIIDAINGVRATLETGDTRKTAIDGILKNLSDNNTDPEVVSLIQRQAEALANKYTDSSKDITLFLEQLIVNRATDETELSKKVSDLIYDRRGFILEFAGASGYNATGKSLEQLGFWGNASYYISANDLFTITARYKHRNNDTSLTNLDVGLGFLKKTSAYNISVEGLLRWYRAGIPDKNINNQPITRLVKDISCRFAAQGSFMIGRDISINLSIGKDFNTPFISGSGFFSILGFNYSIFNKEIINPPVAK